MSRKGPRQCDEERLALHASASFDSASQAGHIEALGRASSKCPRQSDQAHLAFHASVSFSAGPADQAMDLGRPFSVRFSDGSAGVDYKHFCEDTLGVVFLHKRWRGWNVEENVANKNDSRGRTTDKSVTH